MPQSAQTSISTDQSRPNPHWHGARIYAACALGWYAVMFLIPEDFSKIWYGFGAVATIVACAIRIGRLPETVKPITRMMFASGTLAIVAGATRAIESAQSGEKYPFPSVADAVVLVSYALLIIAMVKVIRRRVARLSLDPWLDALVGGTAIAVLQWTIVILPMLDKGTASGSAVLVNLIYAVVSLILVFSAILALVAGGHRSPSNRILASALLVTVAVDAMATAVTADWLPDDLRMALAPLAVILGATGLLHPSIVLITSRPSDPSQLRRLTRRRLAVLGLALLACPVLIVHSVLFRDSNHVLLPTLASLTLAPFVVIRLGRLVRQNEELARLEARLREVGEQLVSADSPLEVGQVVTTGAESLLSGRYLLGDLVNLSEEGEQLVDPEIACATDWLRTKLEGREHVVTGELIGPERNGKRWWTTGLVVEHDAPRAALVLATDRAPTDEEMGAISALCREAAIALKSIDLTELEVRQRSEARFGALINNSSDVVAVLNKDLAFSYVSPVAERLLGYPQDVAPFQGDSAGNRISGREATVVDLVHPDDRDAALAVLETIKEGQSSIAELRLRHFAGTYSWFEVVGVDMRSDSNINGIIINAREISDRKRAEEQLRISEARFKALVQNSTDLVVVLDRHGVFRYASPSLSDLVSIESSELIGMKFADVFVDNDLDWSARTESTLPGTNDDLVEFGFRGPEGAWHTVETTISDLRDEPAINGFVLNARDVTYRKSMEQQLRFKGTHDELTGLANRVHALEDLAGMLSRNSGATTVAAILVDIDEFKDINDSLGHDVGDELLKAIAQRITGTLSFGDVAARIGGDEFVLVVERSHGETQVMELAEDVLAAITTPFEIQGRELSLTASVGIVFDHDRSTTGEVMLRNADTAMYKAKQLGKRQIVVFESYMHTASFDRLELRADLARAVAHNQFLAYYQPVVNLETQRIVGAEALIRWEHPTRGMLGPNLFIPLAEDTGLIGPMGEWILERACRDLAQWREQFAGQVDSFTISVNLAAQQLHSGDIVSKVSDILALTGVPARRLVLEVTESTLITDTESAGATMSRLRDLGTRLSIDDFGTGYSSLGYIQQFDFDVLKIDKTFVDDLDRLTNQRIVTAVLDLANNLGVKTIAEGIEEESQLDLLKVLGCKLGQGYLFSRPVPREEFTELLAAESEVTPSHLH